MNPYSGIGNQICIIITYCRYTVQKCVGHVVVEWKQYKKGQESWATHPSCAKTLTYRYTPTPRNDLIPKGSFIIWPLYCVGVVIFACAPPHHTQQKASISDDIPSTLLLSTPDDVYVCILCILSPIGTYMYYNIYMRTPTPHTHVDPVAWEVCRKTICIVSPPQHLLCISA